MMCSLMAGYHGYSMSNNACYAYECGKRPKSKWTKAAILEALAEYNGEEFAEAAKPYKVSVLKEAVLETLEWHHTSSKYNRTAFYEPKEYGDVQEMLADIEREVEFQQAEKENKEEPPASERWHVKYGVWGGTSKHPKLEWVEADGTLESNRTWFTCDDGTKKKVSGNYFQLLYQLKVKK